MVHRAVPEPGTFRKVDTEPRPGLQYMLHRVDNGDHVRADYILENSVAAVVHLYQI